MIIQCIKCGRQMKQVTNQDPKITLWQCSKCHYKKEIPKTKVDVNGKRM